MRANSFKRVKAFTKKQKKENTTTNKVVQILEIRETSVGSQVYKRLHHKI